jgi:hypothetical protein
MVSSASALPGAQRSPPAAVESTMDQLFEETRAFHLSRQKLHEEEREVWNREREVWKKERGDFLKRIDQLEAIISNLLKSGHIATSPNGTDITNTRFCSYPPQPPPQTFTSTGREIWQGPESQPTRTFSEPAQPPTSKTIDRLNIIPEHGEANERKKSVGFALDNSESRQAIPHIPGGIPGEMIDPNYAGVMLKPNILAPEIFKNVVNSLGDATSPGSPSPRTTSTPPIKPPPVVVRPKLLDLPTANRNSEQLYSEDAGHTPLARMTEDESIPSSKATPITKTIEQERPPLEPHPTQAVVRPPHERAESYFPQVTDTAQEGEAPDEDPALKEPLALSSGNGMSGDTSFLDKVNSALERQISRDSPSEQPIDDSTKSEPGHHREVSDADFPRLKMKRSTNFGAPFGESGPSKGF